MFCSILMGKYKQLSDCRTYCVSLQNYLLIFRQDQTSLRCSFDLACNIKTSFYSLASCHVVQERFIVKVKWMISLSICVKNKLHKKTAEYFPYHFSMMFLHYIWSFNFKKLKKIINIQEVGVVWINFVLLLCKYLWNSDIGSCSKKEK